jgi:DnaJ homolog subfamily C member 28
MTSPDAERDRRDPRRRELADWEYGVERLIREAQERGEFDRLPGAGKPLQLEDDRWAGDWAMAYHVVRLAGETLPWIALGREIEADRERLQGLLDRTADHFRDRQAEADAAATRQLEAERLRARATYLEAAANLDKKLAEYSFLVPTRRLDPGRLPPQVAAQRFDAACPPFPRQDA